MEDSRTQHESRGDPFLWSQHTILERETGRAESELQRPFLGLLLSGVIAGSGIALSPLLRAVVETTADAAAPSVSLQLIMAVAYSIGFIIVIMSHTDLFTEYTTMAILPVLTGQARISMLARLWGLVYAGNLLGVAGFAGGFVLLGPRLGIVEPTVFMEGARRLVDHSWWIIILSALLTGWLMGLLSWLVSAAGDAMSRIVFVGLIASVIAFAHLHHAISGSGEVLMGLWAGDELQWSDGWRFLVWTTLGNAVGGVAFAGVIRYSVIIGGGRDDQQGEE